MPSVMQQMLLAGELPPATLAFQQFGNVTISGGPNVATATGWALGTPSLTRTVYALISWNNGTTSGPVRPLTSVTIDGIPATIVSQNGGDLGFFLVGCAIVSAQVPNDATGNVVMTFQPGASFYNIWVATYSAGGLANPVVPVGSFSSFTVSGSSRTEHLAVQKGGILLSAMFILWDTTSTVTGITRDYNNAIASAVTEGGSALIGPANPAYAVSVSVSGTSNYLMLGTAFR